MHKRSPLSKMLTALVVVFVSVAMVGGPLLALPLPAQAQKKDPIVAAAEKVSGGLPVMNISDQVGGTVDAILTQLTRAGVVAFFNAAQTFFGQLAYDAANYLASGGKGQAALVYKQGFGDYLATVGADVAGDFIGSLSDDSFFQSIGFDLCKPSVPGNLLNIQLSLGNFFPGLQSNFERPRPKCDFQQVIANYDQLYTTLSNSEVSDYINASMSPAGNDLGISAEIFGRSITKIASDTAKKQLDRAETGGFKSVVGVVSGNVKTPASLVQSQIDTQLVKQPAKDQADARNIILSNAFNEGPIQLVVYTASVFLNTLGSKLMERIFNQGIVGGFSVGSTASVNNIYSVSVTGVTDARKANIDLRDVNLIRTSDVEIISELITCPETRGLWNCVIDQGLTQAIQTTGDKGNITIQEALANNQLHGDWRLIPTSDARENLDPKCYTFGYCAGNLQKLRVLRILPVGFELAANSEANLTRCATDSGCATLQTVVDGFADCSASGTRDVDHPWCKLIDPNWVVTSFSQQCQLSGYGDSLLNNRLPQRKQECQDIQTCLQRNDKGECVGGYGYCLAERTAYRFNADECPAQFTSCRNFQSRAGQAVSYNRSTLDYGVCSAQNVGCYGYLTQRNTDGSWAGTPAGTEDKIYFDNTLKPCSASDDGCTKLVATEVGQTSLNLILNPSFERSAGDPATVVVWEPTTASISTVGEGNTAVNGSASFPLMTGGPRYMQSVDLAPLRSYVISGYFRARSVYGTSDKADITVEQVRADGTIIPSFQQSAEFRSSGCDTSRTNIPVIVAADLGTDWQRFECTFLTTAETAHGRVVLHGLQGSALVDAVQLEAGDFATNFVDGYNVSLPVVHMKIPPDDLACTGAATDSVLCNNYAKVCRQVDAGCQGYSDVTGGPEVPAILSSNDLCPDSCVGYTEYRKAPSAFDLIQDADPRFNDPTDATPSYFVAETGQQCSQEDVGCEVFTNVQAAAAGGEQTQAFNYLRSCQLPNDQTQTYFTWEGSDTSGFQLRTWSLISDPTAGGAPQILQKRGPDGVLKEPETCNEGLWRSGVDPDCRQFYNSAGDVFYTYFSETILSTDACTSWRLPRTNTDDCKKTGGSYSPSTGECTYQLEVSESRTCRAQFAGCRAYMGSGSGNVQTILRQDFRSGVAPFESGTESSESLLVGDSSLRIDPVGGVSKTSVIVSSAPDGLYTISFWAKSPARTDVVASLGISDASAPGAAPTQVGAVRLGADWQRFTVGNFNGALGATSTRLTWTFTGDAGVPLAVFLDEVYVNQIQDVAYTVRDSWNTPIECDQSPQGTPQPQAMLGCRAYNDRFSNRVNAFRFTRLCRADAIGCRAFIDTRNTDSIGAENFVMSDETPVPKFNDPTDVYPSATTTLLADRMSYFIYDSSKLCQPENASCRAFGKPSYTQDRQNFTDIETVYYKNNETQYAQALCRPSEQFCEEFSYGGSKDYFRDPQDHACEYKDAVRLSSASFADDPELAAMLGPSGSRPLPSAEIIYAGWFRQGTNKPCYPEYLQGGRVFGINNRGDDPYTGWAATCPAEVGECTAFRDPNDASDPVFKASGRPYYFINNDKLDSTSCSGNIDASRGCILLRNMSDTQLTYSVNASYKKYETNDFQPTTPVNCALSPSDPACLAVNSTSTDANVILKVNVDRDCAQWLGCKSSETVFDPATNHYKDICTNLAICDKSTGIAGDVFCANYIDRSVSSTEPILTKGAFFNADVYTARKVGLGAVDYDGYTIPNSFLVPDLVSVRVGAEGAHTVTNNQYRFAQDYRLAAAVRIPVVHSGPGLALGVPGPQEAAILDSDPIGTANPDLSLCRQISTGIIGYYRKDEIVNGIPRRNTVFCYVPVSAQNDGSNFQNLANKFGLDDPRTDSVLTSAFPPPECRAQPEADSPYPASYVTNWDFATNPPKAVEKLSGFLSANTCEFGQDCSCSYKRADYAAAGSKFFGPLAQDVPPGLCVGGPRAGQSCLPSTIFQVQTQTQEQGTSLDAGAIAANASQTCGPPEGGGVCIAFNKVEVVRGIFGQCLERDQTRFLGNDQSIQPCLTWNPTPILFGNKDPFHYQPTSGYLPPQNSGQYYCTSAAKEPTVLNLTQDNFKRYSGSSPAAPYDGTDPDPGTNQDPKPLSDYTGDSGFLGTGIGGTSAVHQYSKQFRNHQSTYAGAMTRLDYSVSWVSPNEEERYHSASLVDVLANTKYPTANTCKSAYRAERAAGGDFDGNALRIVDAGSGYTETFFRINDLITARDFGRDISIPEGGDLAEQYSALDSLMSNFAIGYFKITPAENGTVGRLGCGYQSEWVDNMPAISYRDAQSLEQAESSWRRGLSDHYNPFLTRATEKVLTAPEDPTTPVLVNCLTQTTDTPGKCYFKTWETGYRIENKTKQFLSLFSAGSSVPVRNFDNIREAPFISTCEHDQPYFGIRAVFQSPESRTTEDSPTVNDVKGPWRFVGFWVSSCGGDTAGDQRYIYMSVDMGSVSICRDLAEVQSSASRSDAAFTDRVWQQSGFTEPGTSMQYNARSAPFSSALNTRPAGEDPLFQNGFELAGFSPLHPPAFLQPGVQSYYRSPSIPREKYAYLSNLFARIYRVYRFHYEAVTKTDKACLEGPFKGTKCTLPGGYDPACNVDGTCNPDLLSFADKMQVRACSEAGISTSVQCGTNPDVCKAPSFMNTSGEIVSAYLDCIANDPDDPEGGTRCADGSVNTAPASCTTLATHSVECPVEITSGNARCALRSGSRSGVCVVDGASLSALKRALPGISDRDSESFFFNNSKSCTTASDCTFTDPQPGTATCKNIADTADTADTFGRCDGGVRDSALCTVRDRTLGCKATGYSPEERNEIALSCGAVSNSDSTPVDRCIYPSAAASNTSNDPSTDNNICTHGIGYVPRLDLCPNPDDEYCGLFSYKFNDSTGSSIDPRSANPFPTDVTLGYYTPYFLGWTPATGLYAPPDLFNFMAYHTPRPPRLAAPDTRDCATPGQCPISQMDAFNFNGQASGIINVGGGQQKSSLQFYAWADHDQMPLRQIRIDWGDGGTQLIDDAKLKNRKPFCGVQKECSDPIRGAGLTCQTNNDCPAGTGTCEPVGRCATRSYIACSRDSDCTYSRTSGSVTTEVPDTCKVRTLFGNSTEACQKDYFDYNHVYSCSASEKRTLPSCQTGLSIVGPNQCYFGVWHGLIMFELFRDESEPISCRVVDDCNTAYRDAEASDSDAPAGTSCGLPPTDVISFRCSRDTNRACTPGAPDTCAPGDECIQNLAPVGGCFDETINSCRFTPRVQVQDNWGWCAGECRSASTGGQPDDSTNASIKHPYGGCFSAETLNSARPNIRFNTKAGDGTEYDASREYSAALNYVAGYANSECSSELPNKVYPETMKLRPWVVYPGSIQLRFSGESTAP